MKDIIKKVKQDYADIATQLTDPAVAADPSQLATLGKKQAALDAVIAKIAEYEQLQKAMHDNAELVNTETDPEMQQMALEENTTIAQKLPIIEKELEVLLLPKDPNDTKDVIVEIRAGAGGDESALFAADLFRMYTHVCEKKNWRMALLHSNTIGIGGYKEIIFELAAPPRAESVFKFMKFESGVHRVQRIPQTEKQGRVHTSTATVAVLPQAEESEIAIAPKDLRIDTFASSGPGGQSVNTTMSAVRITHIPSGIVVSCQDGKSQHKNKEKALSVLRARLAKAQEDQRLAELGAQRKSQVGTGDRSEKIRTYNFPQDRITDHRIKKSWSNIESILNGNLDAIVTELQEEENRQLLAAQG